MEFAAHPQQFHSPTTVEFGERAKAILEEIRKIVEKGDVTKVKDHTVEGFISRLFLVRQKYGQMRPVMHLKPINSGWRIFVSILGVDARPKGRQVNWYVPSEPQLVTLMDETEEIGLLEVHSCHPIVGAKDVSHYWMTSILKSW